VSISIQISAADNIAIAPTQLRPNAKK
jgi:hypothetical protein